MKRKEIKKIIDRYVKAYDVDSWKGGGDPADWPAIEKELRESRKVLKAMIEEIGEPD